MKTLTPVQMISLLPLTPKELEVGEMLMACAMPEYGNAESTLHAMVEEGFLETVCVRWNCISQYAVWYHVAPGGILVVNGTQRLSRTAVYERLAQGVEALARSKGCKFIEGSARRAGIVHEMLKHGYEVTGVTVLKKL
jgi:pyruvate/2-oxoglutarate dehydrogenase complex dihydrolipoamide dehydrogenase (E3) component